MNDELNDIGKLFKSSLGSNPGGEPVDPWGGIEKRVIRSNFFRFNAATFNVYYFAIIFVFASTMGFSAFKAASFNREIKKKNAIIRQYQRKELEEKIKIYIADSIKMQMEEVKLQRKMNSDSALALASSRSIELKADKKNLNEPKIKTSVVDMSTDTITRVTIKKKVIKKQLVVKKQEQIRDSIVVK